MATLQAVQAVQTSAEDLAAFPNFEAEMMLGGGFKWESFPVTTFSGYELMLFRLTGNATGEALAGERGPVLLLHGSYSDSLDWISCTDESAPSIAVQLAQRGHDVWISSGRGRQFSNTHTTLSSTDPLTE